MPERNGVALLSGTRKPIVLRHETITYQIERADGETVALAGYVKGLGCPVEIAIGMDEVIAEWSENVPTIEDGTELNETRWSTKRLRAERICNRDMLRTAIPGLSQEDASLLAANAKLTLEILTELRWLEPTDAEDAAEGEAVAGEQTPSTGEPVSPASSSRTRARTRSR